MARASESNRIILSSDVMDLDPIEVANVVDAINPMTLNYQEDPIHVALAMKDLEYLGKPIITETAQTEIAVPIPVERKATISYTVDSGDTLSSIGWQYGLKIATIKATNNLTSETIKQGQVLKLPAGDISPAAIKKAQDAAAKKKVAGASFNPTVAGGKLRRPTSGWHVSQVFGHTSFESNHTGIDLDSRSGLGIYAAGGGKVVSVTRGWGGGYGNHIIIDHGGGIKTLYGHMSSFKVGSGQYVQAGQQIGVMGNTGWSTGTHLHFEVRVNGRAVNPTKYL